MYQKLNSVWHRRALNVFMFIVRFIVGHSPDPQDSTTILKSQTRERSSCEMLDPVTNNTTLRPAYAVGF